MVYSAEQSHSDCEFHEQVYSWETEEDIWGSLLDTKETSKVRDALITAFDPSRSTAERSISHLQATLVLIKELLDREDATGWSDCNKAVRGAGDEEINLRANTLLLLYRHLEWIWTIFRHVPGASVTAR